jgi:tRNA threonylcarbamoyladenosine biosynthesis protein TsaB
LNPQSHQSLPGSHETMILLATDTSGKNGSIALARVSDATPDKASRASVEILEVMPLAGGTFSAQLIPQIAALLSKHGFTKQDIGGFAVASGPGSFTGLRVGLAAIKALAEILHKPIAAVSLLEAVARSAKSSGRVLAALDAGRGEIYVGDYEIANKARMHSECLVTRDAFLTEAGASLVVTPDAALAQFARAAGLKVEEVAPPAGDAMARLGWEKIRAGETIPPDELEANYIRRSDAEIFAKTNL